MKIVELNKELNKYIWKWHYISGMIFSPLILFLLITGAIYLFKNIYEDYTYSNIKKVEVKSSSLTYERQFEIVQNYASKAPSTLIINNNINEVSTFEIGKWSKKTSILINPYTGEIKASIKQKDTLMHKVKKLHGELLLSSYGTKVIELTASWMVVLILSGMYLCLPKKGGGLKNIFIIRLNAGKLAFYRDLHSVLALLMSILLLLTLAGGLPWTDVWGGLYKEVQKSTNSGYPKDYSGKKLKSINENDKTRISIDDMVDIAKDLNLNGKVTLILPKNSSSVFTIKNRSLDLYDQKVYHYNQYSKVLIKSFTWNDVGAMMQSRQWVMRFHQGLFGTWNFVLMLLVCLLTFISILAGMYAYILRKDKKDLKIPSSKPKFGYGFIIIILFIGAFFPLFGLSLLCILIYESFKKLLSKK